MGPRTAQPNDSAADGHDHDHGHDHSHDHDHDHPHDHDHGTADHDHQHDHRSWPVGWLAALFHLGGHSHREEQLIDDPAFAGSQEGIRTVWLALGLLGLTTLIKVGLTAGSLEAQYQQLADI